MCHFTLHGLKCVKHKFNQDIFAKSHNTNSITNNGKISRNVHNDVMLQSKDLKTFPDCLKLAHEIQMFKKDDLSVTSNYRPISLYTCIGKVFFTKYCLISRHFLYSNNFSLVFLPGHSTVFPLLDTYHSIVKSIDDSNYCFVIFCFISKAFDKV